MLVKFFVPVFLVSCVLATDTNEYIDLFKNITTQDQLHFIQYHVSKGYFIANNLSIDSFENGFDDEYSKGMFQSFMKLSEKQNKTYGTTMNTNLGQQICGPHGPCFDPDDAGTHP